MAVFGESATRETVTLSIDCNKEPFITKGTQELCINKECKTKYLEGDAGQEAKEIAKGIIEKKCTKCDDGMMVLRSSLYGKFLGCNKFPKCKHMEKLTDDSPLKEDFKKKEK